MAQLEKNPPANAEDVGSTPSGRSPGERNGKPLQYSCLGNPMDRGAWWATVHGAQKSQTSRLNNSSSNEQEKEGRGRGEERDRKVEREEKDGRKEAGMERGRKKGEKMERKGRKGKRNNKRQK